MERYISALAGMMLFGFCCIVITLPLQ